MKFFAKLGATIARTAGKVANAALPPDSASSTSTTAAAPPDEIEYAATETGKKVQPTAPHV